MYISISLHLVQYTFFGKILHGSILLVIGLLFIYLRVIQTILLKFKFSSKYG